MEDLKMKNEYSLTKQGGFLLRPEFGNNYNVYEIKITTNNKKFLERTEKGIDRLLERIIKNKEDVVIDEYLSEKINETNEKIDLIKNNKDKNILDDNEFRDLLLKLQVLKDIQEQL